MLAFDAPVPPSLDRLPCSVIKQYGALTLGDSLPPINEDGIFGTHNRGFAGDAYDLGMAKLPT
jgi:hypothetical protein